MIVMHQSNDCVSVHVSFSSFNIARSNPTNTFKLENEIIISNIWKENNLSEGGKHFSRVKQSFVSI